jgi:hypothetical protein
LGLYNIIFFRIRLSSILYTWCFHYNLDFIILAFRLKIFSPSLLLIFLLKSLISIVSIHAWYFSLFPDYEQIKVGLWDHLAVCVSVCVSALLNFECLKQSLLNLGCVLWNLTPSQRRN